MNMETTKIFTFSCAELEELARQSRKEYKAAKPWPNIVIDDFLPVDVAELLLENFPKPDDTAWLDWRERDVSKQPKKQGIGHAANLEGVSPYIHNILFAFNSFPFLNFLEKLTGIRKLISDPHYLGGGIQQVLNGGKLSLHTDFNYLGRLNLYRQINILLYLNKDWCSEYNGDLELWDAEKRRCEKKIEPIFNRLVVFNTNTKTIHGHPQTLVMPSDVTRKAIALYYYTSEPTENESYEKIISWKEF